MLFTVLRTDVAGQEELRRKWPIFDMHEDCQFSPNNITVAWVHGMKVGVACVGENLSVTMAKVHASAATDNLHIQLCGELTERLWREHLEARGE